MRLVLLAPMLAIACASAVGTTDHPGQSVGWPPPIEIVSARFGAGCKGPSEDVGPLFRKACEGKWRCTVRTSREVTGKWQAIEQAGKDNGCGAAYQVEWTCGDGTGQRRLRNGPGARFRLSCRGPTPRDNDTNLPVMGQPAALARQRVSGDDLQGRFLGTWSDPVAERAIVVGKQRVSPDATGAFRLSQVPARYDLALVEQNGAQISLYLGLSRRDPVVARIGWQDGQRRDMQRAAEVSGRVSGPALPKGNGRLRSTLHFFSARRPHRVFEAGFFGRSYPDEIPNTPISWAGPSTLHGRMLVFIESVNHPNRAADQFVGIASAAVTLEDGDSLSEDLVAVPLGEGRLAGTWNPAKNPRTKFLAISYELDDGSGEFWVGGCELRDSANRVLTPARPPVAPADASGEVAFDCPVRDVTFLPGHYRVFIMSTNNQPLPPEAERLATCAFRVNGQQAALPCQQAINLLPKTDHGTTTVAFTSPPPAQMSDLTKDSVFTWEAQPHSVYAIELTPQHPSSLVPAIWIVTSETTLRWSDLSAYGIGFPTSARYLATVTSIPVASVDHLASLDWWYGTGQRDAQPGSKKSGVRLTDPRAPVPDPRAPSNVKSLKNFPAGLPRCAPGLKGQGLDSNSMGHMVTLAARLGRGFGECALRSAMGCSSEWALVDVQGSPMPIALGRDAPDEHGPSPAVIATGLLQDGPILKQANLCLVGDQP